MPQFRADFLNLGLQLSLIFYLNVTKHQNTNKRFIFAIVSDSKKEFPWYLLICYKGISVLRIFSI